MSELPDGCVLRGCDQPWFDYGVTGCVDAPSEQPALSDISGSAPQNGVAYSETITVEDSTLVWTFTIDNGALPTGLTIASTGDAEATLSGTPTTPGSYSFVVKAEDGWGVFGLRGYTLVVT
jgi:hypothetical protein